MVKIKTIRARQILDSRGYPTIEGKLTLDNDMSVSASVPAGTSVSAYEAVELRDLDQASFDGMGVTQAVTYINDLIAPKLVGVSPFKQQEIDLWLVKADGTKDRSKLGSNTMLTISLLTLKAGALINQISLYRYLNSLYNSLFKSSVSLDKIPTPIFNVINGGMHANNHLEFQEFQIIPSSSLKFFDALKIGVEIFHELKRVLLYRNANVSVGEEGGFTPNFQSNIDALEVLQEAIVKKGRRPGLDIFLGLDLAATQFYKNDRYELKEKPHPLKHDEYFEYLTEMIKNYPFLALEDPFAQDDIGSWKKLNSQISKEIYLIGDDLVATNKDRLLMAIKDNLCSSVLIKPNQIGTVTETLEVVELARKNSLNIVASHRSGETTDTFIADFAVGIQSDFVKFGAPSRGERVVKYNRLLEIEQESLKNDRKN